MLKRLLSKNKYNIAINGFGRIGRSAFKVLIENSHVNVVAINDLADTETLANLLQYDSVYGKYNKKISYTKDSITIEGSPPSPKGFGRASNKYQVLAVKDPAELPWKSMNIDVVLECTGLFRTKETAGAHLTAGAKRVIISAPSSVKATAGKPAKDDTIKTIVKGVNENKLKQNEKIISMASCTTNGLAAVTDVINKNFGIKKAVMTTVHAYTSTQNLVDGPSRDPRRSRAAAVNIIPTTTGAAIATTEAIPELAGKFDGMAMRVPVINGSVIDVVYLLNKKTSEQKVNEVLRKASGQSRYKGIITVSKEPLVSSDIIGNSASAIVDMPFTKVVDGDLLKLIIWYDNELGYSTRLAEMAEYFCRI
ncbi:MAG: type I glyceraldehyde-3-phosphate dehydrogenase [Candidatus Falkowbacteria bacterium]